MIDFIVGLFIIVFCIVTLYHLVRWMVRLTKETATVLRFLAPFCMAILIIVLFVKLAWRNYQPEIEQIAPRRTSSTKAYTKLSSDGRKLLIVKENGDTYIQEYDSYYDYFPDKKSNAQSSYTGIILDCKGLGFNPAYTPQIYTENSLVLYHPSNEKKYSKYDYVSYCKTKKQAIKLGRVGNRPAILKAVKIVGRKIYISLDDLKKVSNYRSLFKQGRITILV